MSKNIDVQAKKFAKAVRSDLVPKVRDVKESMLKAAEALSKETRTLSKAFKQFHSDNAK